MRRPRPTKFGCWLFTDEEAVWKPDAIPISQRPDDRPVYLARRVWLPLPPLRPEDCW